MYRTPVFALLLFFKFTTFTYGQSYDTKDYQVIIFFPVDEYFITTYKWNKETEKIDLTKINSLEIQNMGYIPEFDFLKKFKSLENVLIMGDDYDDSLKILPKELLKIKSIKRIFLDRIAFELTIKHQIEKERPDIEVFWYDQQYYRNLKTISHYPQRKSHTIIYPIKTDYPGSFFIDSLLKIKNKSVLDYLEISFAYTDRYPNSGMQEYLYYKELDSLYKLYRLDAYNLTYRGYSKNPLSDSTKAFYYFNEAFKKAPNCGEVILYGIYFYKNIKQDSLKACDFYHTLVTKTDSLHFVLNEKDYDNFYYLHFLSYLHLDGNFPSEGGCHMLSAPKWPLKRNY